MIRQPTEDDINETRELWEYFGDWIKKLGFTPETLAPIVKLSAEFIERGLRGEYVPVRDYIYRFAFAFGIIGIDYRKDYNLKPGDILPPYDKLKDMLKPRQARLYVDWGCNGEH